MSTKYLKIYQQLREEILHQDTPSNTQLPDEISLTKKFHCSRMTVKKALDMLVDEGLIYRKRGQGTFIMPQVEQKHKIIVPERDIQGLTKISKQSHAQVHSEIIHFKLEFATKSIAEKLQISVFSPIYNIFRLRIIDDKPYVLEQTYMSTDLISGITEEILHHSIYSYIEGTLKLRIASAMKILRASISTETDQKYLHLSPTEPIFEVEQIAYLDNGTPFEYSISRHRYDLFEFSSYGLKNHKGADIMQPIFLKPVLQEKIWGGKKLQTEFNLTLPSDKVGESWSISAHPNGHSTIISPSEYQGMTLAELYAGHADLFHQQTLPTFPLLIKILDASDDLSIQVHPDDAYGLEHEHELGKNECWYVISAEPGAKIIYGHTAQTKEEFVQLIQEEKWNELFTEVPVKAGDFFNVPSGTIHAIGKGIVILETQQNSDTTYRVYDYDRKDDAGNPRPLHIPQTIDVTTIPHQLPNFEQTIEKMDDATITHFITNHYFSVWKWEIDGTYHTTLDNNYYLATVIEGEGTLEVNGESFALKKADSFILPTPIHDVTVKGNLTLIVSRSEE